jgi:hypothetical protein
MVYTPTQTETGSDTFAFHVNDGLADSPEATVDIKIRPPDKISLGGRVEYYSDATRKVAGVQIGGASGSGTVTTGSDGLFSLEVQSPGGFSLQPTLTTDSSPAHGVTTADITAVRRHILGIARFENALQLLAGDVNQSGTMSTLDITLMRRLILGISTSFNGQVWRFVPSGSVFGDPLNPWKVLGYRDYVSRPATSLFGQDFKAIKLGDVNGSWTPVTSAPKKGLKQSTTEGRLRVVGGRVRSGEEVKVEVWIEGVMQATSLQGTVRWDARSLGFVGMERFGLSDMRSDNVATHRSNEGMLMFSWDSSSQVGVDMSGRHLLFVLRLRAMPGVEGRTAVWCSDEPTILEATSNFEVVTIRREDGFVMAVGEVGATKTEPRLWVQSTSLDKIRFGLSGPEGMRMGIQVSEDLDNWLEEDVVVGLGDTVSIDRSVSLPKTSGFRFWRVR